MKLTDILLLGLALAFIVIGVDQTLKLGFANAYWSFMVALVPFFVYTLRKAKSQAGTNSDANKANTRRKPSNARGLGKN
jgi:hypothetical protein